MMNMNMYIGCTVYADEITVFKKSSLRHLPWTTSRKIELLNKKKQSFSNVIIERCHKLNAYLRSDQQLLVKIVSDD